MTALLSPGPLLFALAVLSSCSQAVEPSQPSPQAISVRPTVLVGQGEIAYAPLADGALVAWEAGTQGGHHVWIALRVEGLLEGPSTVTVDVDDETYGRLAHVKQIRPLASGIIVGERIQLDGAGGVSIALLEGRRVTVTAAVEDATGASAEGRRMIVLTGKP